MAIVHFLNVKEGDCSVIQHDSGRNTVIDVCNAKPAQAVQEAQTVRTAKLERGISGNFQQKKYPVNPISYMIERGINSVFRYIQTHPDMDHMDGIEAFFNQFCPSNFWDTDNTKEMNISGWESSPYRRVDWEFYKRLRKTRLSNGPKRLELYSGARGCYYNQGSDSIVGGDDLHILAPTMKLVTVANEVKDYNRCSYVILFRTNHSRILFAGDSHDETWDYILRHHESDVTDIDLLIAPHHGRSSGRSYDFLATLTPTLTFFGNAQSEHLAYSAWNNRGLKFITNNQANCMLVDTSTYPMTLHVTHERFARKLNPLTCYNGPLMAWCVGRITKHLIP